MTADTLTQLTAKVQATLQDSGTLFTAATITAAARLALRDINRAAPRHEGTTITTIANQKVYELTAADAGGCQVIDVALEGSNDDATGLDFTPYVEDGRQWFRLQTPQPAGKTMDVIYTKAHTVSGLDSATDSTLTDELNDALVHGTTMYACLTRAAYAAEANNVGGPSVPANWMKLATMWQHQFDAAISRARKDTTAPSDTPVPGWNDSQHSGIYP